MFLSGGDFVARILGAPGAEYTIEVTPAVSPANWQKKVNLFAPADDQVWASAYLSFAPTLPPHGDSFSAPSGRHIETMQPLIRVHTCELIAFLNKTVHRHVHEECTVIGRSGLLSFLSCTE